jgi:hypothetical protein
LPVELIEPAIPCFDVDPPVDVPEDEFLDNMGLDLLSLEHAFPVGEQPHPFEELLRFLLVEVVGEVGSVLALDVPLEAQAGPAVLLAGDYLSGEDIGAIGEEFGYERLWFCHNFPCNKKSRLPS